MANKMKWAVLVIALHCYAAISVQGAFGPRRLHEQKQSHNCDDFVPVA